MIPSCSVPFSLTSPFAVFPCLQDLIDKPIALVCCIQHLEKCLHAFVAPMGRDLKHSLTTVQDFDLQSRDRRFDQRLDTRCRSMLTQLFPAQIPLSRGRVPGAWWATASAQIYFWNLRMSLEAIESILHIWHGSRSEFPISPLERGNWYGDRKFSV